MEILRDRLINELETFVLKNSGIVVGLPGVGKTHSLKELASVFESAGKRCLYIPIDKLDIESEADLKSEMSINQDLIRYLIGQTSVPSNAHGVLLIDAFDAARSSKAQATLRRLITRVRRELTGSWNIIVSVRLYDARKSRDLQELFPARKCDAPPNDFQFDGICCRHFAIPELTQEEITAAVQIIPHLPDIYMRCTDDFRKLLSIPFNIWLLEQLLSDDCNVPDLSSVGSEVQLLGLFWQYRVVGVDGEQVLLTKIAESMVQQNSLSVRKESVFDFIAQPEWRSLFSKNILVYTSSSEQRLAFSHNILFDYAVSVLLLEDEPERLVQFLSEDLSRPLFLRPSLDYFLTRLWYETPSIFWNMLWYIMPANNDIHIRLFARLLPPSVIAHEARSLEQLQPLAAALQESNPNAPYVTLRILQAISMLEVRHDALWASFMVAIIDNLHYEFVGIAASLMMDITKSVEKDNDSDTLSVCGQVNRSLARWFLLEMDKGPDTWLENLYGGWVIPLVTRTYTTNIDESRSILYKVLGLVGHDEFPINFLMALVQDIDKIYLEDPQFAADIYLKVFTYYENSDKTVDWGGHILGLSSTRRQDYYICQHKLIESFPSFLKSSPILATKTLVSCIDNFVIDRHVSCYLEEEHSLEDLEEQFCFRGRIAAYIPDGSSIWDASMHQDEPLEMVDELFTFIRELAHDPVRAEELASLIDVLCDDAHVAFLWRKLLSTASQSPGGFTELLFDLCTARPIQTGIDTVYELGQFLEAAAQMFSQDQLCEIERSIVSIPAEASNADERIRLKRYSDRLLARIPQGLLLTEQAKTLREEMERTNSVPENEPPVHFTFKSSNYTEDMWLEEQGVALTAPDNQALLSFSKPLRDFETKWLNEKPTLDAVRETLQVARRAYNTLQSSARADEAVAESLLTKIGTFARITSRTASDLDEEEFALCREILLSCAEHPSPKSNKDQDGNFNSPAWSPSPRIEAAGGLPWLMACQPDEEMLQAINALADDPVPSVRFRALTQFWRVWFNSPDDFWATMQRRITVEQNRVVLHALLTSLSYVVANDKDKTVKVLSQLVDKALSTDHRKGKFEEAQYAGVLHDIMPIVSWLLLKHDDPWAKLVTVNLLQYPVRFADPIGELTSVTLQNIIPHGDLVVDEEVDNAVALILNIVNAISAGIADLRIVPQSQWNDDLISRMRAAYSVIDTIVGRFYFAFKENSSQPEQSGAKAQLFSTIKPILEQILAFASDESKGIMFAPTAHEFMGILNSILGQDPASALRMAVSVVNSSRLAGYHLDSLAVQDIVAFVEALLADHRCTIRQGESLTNLLNLLDIFVEAGWKEALRLVWRLDEVFR